ncbi:MAG TPA: DUF4350 domain-containing protein [Anaerolineales bacterium]|nr:DUF4350 domain-containing protein [Anaerolineales bacterium]
MRNPRNWLVGSALACLFVLTVWLVAESLRRQDERLLPELATFSSQPNGARAVRLWLEALGYPIVNRNPQRYLIPAETRLLCIFQPQDVFTPEELETLDAWVKAGGRLLLVTDDPFYLRSALLEQFDIEILVENEQAVSPNLPTVTSRADLAKSRYLKSPHAELQNILTNGEGAVAIWFRYGEGQVLVTTLTDSFSNAGLQAQDNPRLALSLIEYASNFSDPAETPIWFDEFHHGEQPRDSKGLTESLYGTAPGKAFLLAVVILLVALWLSGKPFGRTLPLPTTAEVRAPKEYVSAIANLFRRAKQESTIAQHYLQSLKRDYSQRYRIPADLPTDDWLRAVESTCPDADIPALRKMIHHLQDPRITQNDLLKLAHQVSELIEKRKIK